MPAALSYLVGGFVGAVEDHRVRCARREWYRQPWASDLVEEEINAWRADLAERDEPRVEVGANPARHRVWRRPGLVVGAVGILVATPVLTLVPTSAIGPILAAVAVPSFGQAQRRAARAEAFRPYRVEVDASISAQEAGRILQDLIYVGSDRGSYEGELPPTRRYEAPWIAGLQSGKPHRGGTPPMG